MEIDLARHDVASLELGELESGICTFAARLAAATALFLLAVAEYDRRQGWATWECRNMTQWLTWKCGTSPVTAREQVRVGAALSEFPLVRERFCAGELSYSQVRAITRVATPATETDLVDLARSMTAAQLEVVVRAYRRASTTDADTAQARHAKRRMTWTYDDAGMLIGTFCLPPEEGAVLTQALTKAAGPSEVAAADEDGATDPLGAARADALMHLADQAIDHTAHDHPDDPSDRHLVTILVDQATLEAGHNDDSDTGTCQVADGPGLAPQTVRRLACDQPTVIITEDGAGRVLDVGRRTRRIPRPLRRALARRDGRCRFPGCGLRRTQAHHIYHWVDGGHTKLDNLVSLCARHHHRHHEGGYKIETTPGGGLRFVRADGRTIPDICTLESPNPDGLDLDPTAHEFRCHWEGDPLPLADIVGNLIQNDHVQNDIMAGVSTA